MIRPLQEFKPRKAKFGFKIDDFRLDHIIPVAAVLEFLNNAGSETHSIEYGLPYKGRSVIFKVYTNELNIADELRRMFTEPTGLI